MFSIDKPHIDSYVLTIQLDIFVLQESSNLLLHRASIQVRGPLSVVGGSRPHVGPGFGD